MGSAAPRLTDPAEGAAPRTSWPGALVERALALLAADFRRPAGPVFVAAVLAAAAVLARSTQAGPLDGSLAALLGFLATAPIAVIRRFPGPAIGVMLAASAGFVMFGRLSWSAAAVAGWLIALAACPILLRPRRAVLAVAAMEIVVLLATLNLRSNPTPWDATVAEALAVIVAWGAGELLRARRQWAIHQEAAAAQLRQLSERDVAARERASIARELHDVVAHHVSMIAVRAATAPYAITGLPEPGRAAFGEIAEEARTALTELRVVLGVLRAPGGGSETAPQPRLADLDDLLCRTARAGMDVAMAVTGPRRPLPASVELCCYRIVQEALTNAGRHAPGSAIRVELGYRPAALSVRVSNGSTSEPEGRGLGSAPEASGRHRGGPPSGPGRPVGPSGYGLTGLRERVEMLRGEFRAGPAGHGFAVTALLPTVNMAGMADEAG
jgi:signal transduction histidine kinase